MDKVNCKDCLRRTKNDKDYMKSLDCFGNKIDWNCLITVEEENEEMYRDSNCAQFVNAEENK